MPEIQTSSFANAPAAERGHNSGKPLRGKSPTEPENFKVTKSNEEVTLGVDPKETKSN